MIATRLAAASLVLGEGPIRLGADAYGCVDIRRGLVLEGNLVGDLKERASFETTIGSIAATVDGRLLVAGSTSITMLDDPDRSIDLPPQEPDIRLNDGKPDPVGRFVGGTMADPARPGAGTLWSFEAGRATPLLDGVTISNGLCWSVDGSTMFYVDTPTQRIDAFDYDLSSGRLGARRTVVTIPDVAGAPDGMTIDADDGLWVALWGGGTVHRYADGTLDHVIEIPTPYVTSVAFVGADREALLITTANELTGPGDGAGDIYLAELGTRGAPELLADPARVFLSNLGPGDRQDPAQSRPRTPLRPSRST